MKNIPRNMWLWAHVNNLKVELPTRRTLGTEFTLQPVCGGWTSSMRLRRNRDNLKVELLTQRASGYGVHA